MDDKALVQMKEGDMARIALKGGIAVGVFVTAVWLIGFWGIMLGTAAGFAGWKLGRRRE